MSTNNLGSLGEITEYRGKNFEAQLLLDTNVFLLLLVGIYDENYLQECPLMKEGGKDYGKDHYRLLLKIMERFVNKILITPQILVEIDRHSRNVLKPPKFEIYFTKLIDKLRQCQEVYIKHEILLNEGSGVVQFGFTDISIIEAARKMKSAVLTDDFSLYTTFRSKVAVINFSQVFSRETFRV